jgi:hypothetical protein
MNSPAIPLKTNGDGGPLAHSAGESERLLVERIAAEMPARPRTGVPGRAVLQFLKWTAHRLPHPLLLRAFLLKYALHELRLERQARIKNELIPLGNIDLGRHKKSDTVFLLGSGPSINAIDDRKWAAIARHDSMAVNFWLFHKFVPTFYFYEAIGPRTDKYVEAFRRISERRASDYKNSVKVVTGLAELEPDFELFRPDSWRRELHSVYTIPVAARDDREFSYGLRLLRARGLFDRSRTINYVFKQASSITGLISLAVRMGYKRIVLCGVDLHSAEYFYQDRRLYPKYADIEFQIKSSPHTLVTPQSWKVLTDTAIYSMKDHILNPVGVRIHVENRSSRLWPVISEAPNELFK